MATLAVAMFPMIAMLRAPYTNYRRIAFIENDE